MTDRTPEEIEEDGFMKPIPGYPGYFATSTGKIYSKVFKHRGTIQLSASISEGYERVSLNGRSRRVHTLVLLTFSGPKPFPGACTRHLNRNKTDNRIENLAWGTYKENVADCIAHGTYAHGEKHGNAKLTEKIVRELRKRYVPRVLSIQKLADEYGFSKYAVMRVVLNKGWRHVV